MQLWKEQIIQYKNKDLPQRTARILLQLSLGFLSWNTLMHKTKKKERGIVQFTEEINAHLQQEATLKTVAQTLNKR